VVPERGTPVLLVDDAWGWDVREVPPMQWFLYPAWGGHEVSQ